MDILQPIGYVLILIVIFIGLPYLIYKSLKEFAFVSKFQNSILRYSVIVAVLLAYILIMSVFFLFNLKIFE